MDRPYLEIKTAAGKTQLILGDRPISIGRHSQNLIVVADPMASRFHCTIEKTPEGYLLRDLGASNGTVVNGRRVRSALMYPGDVVTIGQTSLVLVLPNAPGVAPEFGKFTPAERQAAAARAAPREASPFDAIPLAGDDDTLDPPDLDSLAALAHHKVESDDELEVLSEFDLVEEDPADKADRVHVEHEAGEDDYEHTLRSLADSMPNRAFSASDIVLIDPRGDIVGTGERGAGGEPQMQYLFRLLLLASLRARASDVHLEPKDKAYQARMRVDGVMVDAAQLPEEIGGRLIGVVKVISHIDPSQRGIVQEGHFTGRLPVVAPGQPAGTRRVDFRVSFAPAVFGQKLVLRILDPSSAPTRIPDLGLPADVQKEVAWAIEQDSGMVLVSGPTGSGKTSTLYALLRSLNLRERNVVTIEDPVEIQIEGATQIPVNDEKGNTFAALLRSVLRQDPDVILVGEIRDAETARIAMQAAITGHLVFSTVHTKDATGTIFRLLDLGVEPYLLSQGLHVVVAQRLVRQLCPFCKAPRRLTPEQATAMGAAGEGLTQTFVPIGCRKCLGTGYAGRRAFFELLTATEKLREAISHSPTAREIGQALSHAPFRRLSQAGFQLVAEGAVPFDEVEKVVGR